MYKGYARGYAGGYAQRAKAKRDKGKGGSRLGCDKGMPEVCTKFPTKFSTKELVGRAPNGWSICLVGRGVIRVMTHDKRCGYNGLSVHDCDFLKS
jgi:hypothetical protein